MAITETRSLPPEFVSDLGKDYSAQLTGLTSQALDTTKFQPMVAGQDQATQDAYSRATTQGQGIGAYAPYLTAAGQYQTGTGTFAGLPTDMRGAQDLTGPDAYKDFMSPYQQQVIDATLDSYDKQAQAGITGIGLQAAKSGNLGGGREGVMRAQYQNQSDMNRALLNAQLLQQGFGQAQNLASQAFGQQQALAAGQLGLAQQTPALLGQQISALTGLGAQQAARAQQGLTAQQQLLSRQALQPLEAAQQFGSGVTQLIAGYPGRENILPPAPTPSPLATGLGTASTLAGIYRLINPTQPTINIKGI